MVGRPRTKPIRGPSSLFAVVAIAVVLGALIALLADRYLLANFKPSTTAPTSTTAGVRGLFVEPDDGRQPVIAEIDAARKSVDVMIYLMTDDAIVDALVNAERRGVEVRVILEQHPYGGFGNPEEVAQGLSGAGAEVKWSGSAFTFTHAKTIVVDRKVALIMNLNLTRSSFESNREFGVVTTWPGEVVAAQAIFDADWSGSNPAATGKLVLSPINSREVLTDLIDGADQTLDIYLEVLRDPEAIDRLAEAEDRGVQVRIIVSPDRDPVAQEILSDLVDRGAEVRFISDPYIHAKAIVVDGERAFIGSQNFTATSMDENREIGLLVEDRPMLDRLHTIFDADFAAASESE
jgi:cardiolipin synthase